MNVAKHQVLVGLGGNGFRAVCCCGWRSYASWDRDRIAKERDEHKRRSRLGVVP